MNNSTALKKLNWPLKDVFKNNWKDKFLIDKNAPFYFKLNDNQKLIKKLQIELKDDSELNRLFDYQHMFTDDLKKNNLWVRVEDSVIPMTMYDVYTGLLKHLKDNSFETQLFNSSEISFVSPMGPYKYMSLIETLNENLIDKFIFSQIMKNKLPTRSMRVHTQGKIKIEFGDDFERHAELEIKQITEFGILFSSKDEEYLPGLEQSDYIKIFIDTRGMSTFLDNDLKLSEQIIGDDFFYTEDELRFLFIEQVNIVKSLSYKSGTSNEVFMFCRYHDMLESDVPGIFYDFSQRVKEYFKNLL